MRRRRAHVLLLSVVLVLTGLAAAPPAATADDVVPDPASCPPMEPMAFGLAADPPVPGVFCRRFEATPGQSVVLRVSRLGGTTSWAPPVQVYDAAGRLVCRDPRDDHDDPETAYCDDLTGGTYVAVSAQTYLDESERTFALYDTRETRGCRPVPDGMRVVTNQLAPGQLDCFTVDVEEGDLIGFGRLVALEWLGQSWSYTLHDEQGTSYEGSPTQPGCRFDPYSTAGCRSPVSGRVRLIGGDRYVRRAVHEQRVVGFDVDDLQSCTPVEVGTTTVDLGPDGSAVCVVVRGLRFSHSSTIDVTSSSPEGVHYLNQVVGALQPDRASCQGQLSHDRHPLDLECSGYLGTTDARVPLVLGGDGQPQRVTFERVDHERPRTFTHVVNYRRPVVRNLTDPDAPARYARVGDVLATDDGVWYGPTTSVDYRWYVAGQAVRGARSPSLTLRRGMIGKPVTSRVVAYDHLYRYPGVAYSKGRIVRR